MHSRWYILKMTFEETCFFDIGPNFSSYHSLSATRYYTHTHTHTHTTARDHRQLFRPFGAIARARHVRRRIKNLQPCTMASRIAARQNWLAHNYASCCVTMCTTNVNSIVLKLYHYNAQYIHTNFTSARAVYGTQYVSPRVRVRERTYCNRARRWPSSYKVYAAFTIRIRIAPYRVWATVFSSTRAFTTMHTYNVYGVQKYNTYL